MLFDFFAFLSYKPRSHSKVELAERLCHVGVGRLHESLAYKWNRQPNNYLFQPKTVASRLRPCQHSQKFLSKYPGPTTEFIVQC